LRGAKAFCGIALRGDPKLVDSMARLAKQLSLAFQLEGLPVGAVLVQQNRLGLLEVEIEGKAPFVLSPEVLETSNPEAGYVSEVLREWIDRVYLELKGYNRM
jgi:hypothetical protein